MLELSVMTAVFRVFIMGKSYSGLRRRTPPVVRPGRRLVRRLAPPWKQLWRHKLLRVLVLGDDGCVGRELLGVFVLGCHGGVRHELMQVPMLGDHG